MEIKPVTIRTYSILGQRGTFGKTLWEKAGENLKIVAVTADMANASGLDRFAASYPERFINVGIAEQNMIGVVAGMADSGYIPFATTYSNFLSLRSLEQIRHFMGYMKCNVKLLGFAGGFAIGVFGATHCGIEDIATIRSIPNIVIFSPADGLETVKCIEASINNNQPTYIRLTGIANNPVVYKSDYDFTTGKAIHLSAGTDIAIFATGSMVYHSQQAAEILEGLKISTAVYDFHTIVPFDNKAVLDNINKKLIVSVEEHSITGGLGSAVAETLSENPSTPPLLRLGIKKYEKAGNYDYMLEKARLTPAQIAEDVLTKFKELSKL
jgi:transketolase